ncbi:MAG: four-carbon acid sugar kinase family protein [Burkholderiales bacterium]
MQPRPRVLIVADDLTGAMDTAGPFAQQGLATRVVAEPLGCDPAAVSAARVVSLNTESRHLSEVQSAQRMQACAERFIGSQSFEVIFKKIDSTLRGNVVSETLALLRSCKRTSALVAPAFPAQGHTVRGGVVHVNGMALPQTSFASDALSPPPLAPLPDVFRATSSERPVVSWVPGTNLPSAVGGIVIADSESDADLATVLGLAKDRLADTLLVGSAGLARALARLLGSGVPEARPPATVDGPIVFVVGSRAASSREQVQRLRAMPGTVVLEAPNGMLTVPRDVPAAAQTVILAVADPITGEGDARQVARGLSHAALQLSRQLGSRALVATGGDTAIALLDASRCSALEVLGELMPGIPYARLTLDAKALLLVTKAGGFGNRETFVEIVRRLRPLATTVIAEVK